MSVTGKRGVGVPLILMHDGEGTIVTVECKNGDTYRGFLDETEDNMNCILKDATRTDARGVCVLRAAGRANKPETLALLCGHAALRSTVRGANGATALFLACACAVNAVDRRGPPWTAVDRRGPL